MECGIPYRVALRSRDVPHPVPVSGPSADTIGLYRMTPVSRPVLTYSRATETTASTQLRAALTALGLVTDSTVP